MPDAPAASATAPSQRADGSFIAVFSCYWRPEVNPLRKLIFESKDFGGGTFDMPLAARLSDSAHSAYDP
ncbi:hypothetical protein AB0C69_28185 [Actinomadura sp. NPDC048032]|uniref:hypothetical protein n=1 Tax=Actinomadura sp. NPDC048032 TaxID=3155747 RepID=UPI0033D7783B